MRAALTVASSWRSLISSTILRAPHALSHEVYSHVRALARVLRKLVAMKGAAASVRPPLPVRPIPGRNAVR